MAEKPESEPTTESKGEMDNTGVPVELSPDNEKLLMHLHERALKEVDFLRERQDRIFAWSSGVLMVLIGALLVIDVDTIPIWQPAAVCGKVIASLAVLVFSGVCIKWQQRNRDWHRENREVATDIADIFRCFEKAAIMIVDGLQDWLTFAQQSNVLLEEIHVITCRIMRREAIIGSLLARIFMIVIRTDMKCTAWP